MSSIYCIKTQFSLSGFHYPQNLCTPPPAQFYCLQRDIGSACFMLWNSTAVPMNPNSTAVPMNPNIRPIVLIVTMFYIICKSCLLWTVFCLLYQKYGRKRYRKKLNNFLVSFLIFIFFVFFLSFSLSTLFVSLSLSFYKEFIAYP